MPSQWQAQDEVVHRWDAEYDEGGKLLCAAGSEVVQEAKAAGDRYSFRMDGLYAFVAAGAQARLLALEARMDALEGG